MHSIFLPWYRTALRWTSHAGIISCVLPMATEFKDGVPGDSSISVPQELIDYILNFLHPTLRTCSLVCHAFLPCSRHYIYSSVTVVHVDELDLFRERYAGQPYQCQNLAALLKHSPRAAPLVTRFGMCSMAELTMEDASMDTSLVSISSSLYNLSHIELVTHEESWDEFPIVTLKPFLTALRSVPLRTFIFCAIALETQEQYEDLFTAAANLVLKHLSLICDRGANWLPGPYPPIRPPPGGLPATFRGCSSGSLCTTSGVFDISFSSIIC